MTTALRIGTNENGEVMASRHMDAPPPVARIKDYLERLTSDEAIAESRSLAVAYDKAVAALIGANDVQVEGERTFKKKSAWRKLAQHFRISTGVVAESTKVLDNEVGDRVFVATCTVRAMAPWGQYAEASGACATDEESGQRVITIADAIATAETRATNRATSNLIAMGEVSAEEMSKGDGAARKAKDPSESKIPFGPNKGTKLKDMDAGDLQGAIEWAEEKGKFADFVAAGRAELERRKQPKQEASSGAAGNGEGHSSTTTSSGGAAPTSIDEALAFAFPFNEGKPIHGKPLNEIKSTMLVKTRDWIREQQQENEDFHQGTIAAINMVLEHREKHPAAVDGGAPSKKALYDRANKAADSSAVDETTRSLFKTDLLNGFKLYALETWVDKLEKLAGITPAAENGGKNADADLPF